MRGPYRRGYQEQHLMTVKIHIAWLPRVRGGPDQAAASGSACEGASLWFGPSAASWLVPISVLPAGGSGEGKALGADKVQARALAAGCKEARHRGGCLGWDPDPLRLVPSPALNVKRRRLGGRVTRNWSNWSRETAALQPTCGQPKCIVS